MLTALTADFEAMAGWRAVNEQATGKLPDHVTDEEWKAHNNMAAGDAIRERPATTLVGLSVKLAYALYSDSHACPTADIHKAGFAGNNYVGLVAAYSDAVAGRAARRTVALRLGRLRADHMTTLRITLQVARLKLAVVRYRARRAVLRLMRRVLDWLEPAA